MILDARTRPSAAAGVLLLFTAYTASAEGTLTRLAKGTGVAASQVSVTNLKSDWVVTAIEDSSTFLELDSWQYNGSVVHQYNRTTAQAITQVSIIAISSSRVVTAVVRSDGDLELNVWTVNSAGAIVIESTYVAGAAKTVDLAKLSSQRVITAIRDGNGNLTLQVWGINSTGVITPKGSVTDIVVSKAAVTALSNSQVVTAVQNSAGNLQLSSWSISGTGNIAHQADANKGAVSQVDVSTWAEPGHVVTAVRNGSQNLEVLDWAVDPSTGAISLLSSKGGGAASKVAISTIGGLIFTAAKNSSGKLNVGVWDYPPVSSQLTEEDSVTYDQTGQVSVAPLVAEFTESVSASINGSGNLELNIWDFV
jgi:hypothetical protein